MHHIVRRGDSLFKIARHHRTHVHHLLRLNPHIRHRPNLLYPGERIRVR